MNKDDRENAKSTVEKGAEREEDALDAVIRSAEFPDDYAAFEDENLNMIP